MCEWSEWREGTCKGVRIEAMTARCLCECECECDCECAQCVAGEIHDDECECDRDCECAQCVAGEI